MELKDIDMEKLEQAFFNNLQRDDCEYGGIGVDSKRPFGNSSVSTDILEIIGLETKCDKCGRDDEFSQEQHDYANALYDNLIDWLQKKYLKT